MFASSRSVRQPRRPRARRLMLSNFRSYTTLDLTIDAPIVTLVGDNGAGKTNILEALSLFAPGRGLRRAEYAEMTRAATSGFALGLTLSDEVAPTQLGVALDETGARKIRIQGAPAVSARAFADHVRVVWMTPAMDGLFFGAAGERRRFLDRLTLAVDSDHGARVAAYDRALRGRNRLLEMGGERAWLDASEREAAELGVAVAFARRETVDRLAALVAAERDPASLFPWADLALEGEMEGMIAGRSALEAEDAFREALARNRPRDAAAGRALVGPQTCDLVVRHGPKGIEARRCSTGEQKALLTGVVLAHARLVAAMSGLAPLILLDEIAAHFDRHRRAALFEELTRLGGQAWLTGADAQAFAALDGRAQVVTVTPGRAGSS